MLVLFKQYSFMKKFTRFLFLLFILSGVPTFEWTKKVSPDKLILQHGNTSKELQFRI